MTSTSLSSSLTGLSLLTGSNAFSATSALPTFESKAVRTAKAQFTLAATTPPWKEAQSTAPLSTQVSTVRAMPTIIDKPGTGSDQLPTDVQSAFTTYKALDRLRLLAEAASSATASNAQRAQLQTSFAKGLGDLQSYLATAPADQVNIAFAQPARGAKTTAIAAPDLYETQGTGLVKNRTDAIPGLTGTEQFSITLTKPGASDTVSVDLSQGPQPPTVDSVAEALNTAIASVPLRNPDGSLFVDANGQTQPRWLVHFVPDKATDKWGFQLSSPSGIEQVTLNQTNARDALVVATGATALDAPTATQVFRIDDPAGDATRKAMASISALDSTATARAQLLGKTTTVTTTSIDLDGKTVTNTSTTSNVYANTDAAAIATDAQGNSYVVGTTKGDLGSNHGNGQDGLFLTKLDGEGKVVWQRSLGAAGSSTGAAISVGSDGSVTVAGTVNGSIDGSTTDGDMVVARYAANGDEKFATVVRSVGADTAKAVAVGNDGSVYVGGRSATEGGDGFVAHIDTSGKITERRTIAMGGSESVTGLAIAGDGNVLALVSHDGTAQVRKLDANALDTELGTVSLGTADARAIAVGADGSIAVGGATDGTLSGTQVNAASGGRDGFVARIDSALSGASVTYLGTSADDQVDSLAFVGGNLYAGGRTTGDLGATRRGPTDGFVAQIDTATGAVASVSQFGQALLRTEPVRIAGDAGGANALSALGFARGTVNPAASEKLTTQLGIRAGDSFSFQADNGAVRKVTITADDTMQTLTDRLKSMLGSKFTVSTTNVDGARSLRIDTTAGHSLELLAGPSGSDALSKLGLDPQRIFSPDTVSSSAPKVRPGGSFGLNLSEALNLSTADDAKLALGKVKDAISMSQTAYRSLYWDDLKAQLADPAAAKAASSTSTAREQAQLANYQAALNRLSSPLPTMGF